MKITVDIPDDLLAKAWEETNDETFRLLRVAFGDFDPLHHVAYLVLAEWARSNGLPGSSAALDEG